MYFEIQADDLSRALEFYRDVFGWKFDEEKDQPFAYWRITTDIGIHGGIFKRPAPASRALMGTNAFVCSLQVGHFAEAEKKILKAGGISALPKFPVPGRCWQGYFLDTEGNTFGIYEVDEKAGM